MCGEQRVLSCRRGWIINRELDDRVGSVSTTTDVPLGGQVIHPGLQQKVIDLRMTPVCDGVSSIDEI
jgi:hypothetical protein